MNDIAGACAAIKHVQYVTWKDDNESQVFIGTGIMQQSQFVQYAIFISNLKGIKPRKQGLSAAISVTSNSQYE